jgi:hypothetical protein
MVTFFSGGMAVLPMKKAQKEQYSEAETVERRDAVLKRMLSMPPKPHSEMKTSGRGKKPISKRPRSGK